MSSPTDPGTTIGFEKAHDRLLSLSKKDFIEENSRPHEVPPYFGEMARRNLNGV